ncbi:MAG: DMT family transporter [Pseudomonadota bacterium]
MNNTKAIVLMIGAMAAFALVDMFVKLASATQSAGQIIALTSAATFCLFAAWELRLGGRLFRRDALNPVLLIRSAGEVIGSIGIVMALALAPLASVAALGQAQPLAVTLGAALFLGETVGWRRWLAVALGFLGVLIIMRPGLGDFDPNLLWVLLYIFGLAARDLASRRIPGHVSTQFAVAWAMLPMALAGALMMPFQEGWHPVDGLGLFYLTGVTLAAAAALWMITTALRTGEVSSVAPFRYTRILFALVIAFVVFSEVPDMFTLAGAALIVGSGLYAFFRERQRAVQG